MKITLPVNKCICQCLLPLLHRLCDFRKREEVHDEKKVFPVCYYKKAEAEVKTGDKVMPVYIDYDAVIHCYTMEGGIQRGNHSFIHKKHLECFTMLL